MECSVLTGQEFPPHSHSSGGLCNGLLNNEKHYINSPSASPPAISFVGFFLGGGGGWGTGHGVRLRRLFPAADWNQASQPPYKAAEEQVRTGRGRRARKEGLREQAPRPVRDRKEDFAKSLLGCLPALLPCPN